MKLIKIAFLLTIILIMIGVCGCMNDAKNYQASIVEYLHDKYGCEFTVRTVFEKSIEDGQYIYATCENTEFNGEIFKVECYSADGEKTGDSIAIDGKEYIIYDRYSDIVFAKQMEKELQQVIEENVFVRCEVLINHREMNPFSVTKAQVDAGMKFCLEQPDFYSYVSVYVVAGVTDDIEKIQAAVERYATSYNAHSQYLCIAVMPEMNEELIKRHYKENKNSFVAHMSVSELILQMESTRLARNKSITGWSIEKG